MIYSHILASTPSGIIGIDNKLPWHYAEDLKYFKNITTGSIVVMGSNTFKSLGCKPLADRINVVLTSAECTSERVYTARTVKTIEDLIRRANEADTKVFIIGGGQMYDTFNNPTEIYQTEVPELETNKQTVKYNQDLSGYILQSCTQSKDKELNFKHYVRTN
jgi:dihydrofolate reductase